MPTIQEDIETARTKLAEAADKLHAIVNGPATGEGSTVEVMAGIVKSVAKAIAEIGDTSNQATKTLDNVASGDFAAKAVAAGVDGAGDMLGENNLAEVEDDAEARANLGLGSAAVEDVAEGGSGGLLRADGDGSGLTGVGAITGTVLWFAADDPPSGWLECDGSAISRSTYAVLFAVTGTVFGAGDGSTTFNLPDLRGEFVRGWDNSRGVDIGRAFGSAQDDAFESHTHSVTAGVLGHYQNHPTPSFYSPRNDVTGTTGSTGGSETRPRNVALLPIIKI